MKTHEQELGYFDVKNASGEVIPPFAVMKVTGATKENGEPVATVNKPDGSGTTFCLNGGTSIGIGAMGRATTGWGKRAALASSYSTGTECGPVSGQWTLSTDGSGWTIIGDVASSTGRVRMNAGAVQDELRGQVQSYTPAGTSGNTYGIITLKTSSPAPIALPTGTPAISGTVLVADVHLLGALMFPTGAIVRAIHNVGIDELSSAQVDWEHSPSASGATVRVVTIDESEGETQGDEEPAVPFESRYFSGAVTTPGECWIWVNDHKRLGRLWMPVGGQFNGLLNGTWDPDPEGEDTDERPLFIVDPESDGETIAIVTTQASAANWSTPTTPVPSTDGRCTTFKVDVDETHVVDATGVAFSNFAKSPILVDSIIALEEFQGQRFATVLASSNHLIAKITATVSARSSDAYGSVGSTALGHLVSGSWTSVLTGQTVYNPSLSPVHVPSGVNIQIPVAYINGHWVLLNATDLQQVEGYDTTKAMSIGKNASSTTVLWQEDGDCD